MNMLNSNKNYQSDDPTWYFLAEYSLSDFMPDQDEKDELTAGLLSHTMRKWGLPVECLQNIERISRNITGEALACLKEGRMDFLGKIRIYCQKKMINQETKGGWGYFMIKRSRDASSGDCIEPFYDFYIYEEGK